MKFQGNNCAFLNDGRTLIVYPNEIKMFDRLMQEKWVFKGHFHHQLEIDEDNQQVALIGAYVKEFLGCQKTRFDQVVLLNIN